MALQMGVGGTRAFADLYTWKTMTTFSVTGLDMFFCLLRFFPNTAMSDCKPSTYRTIGFLNSWICRTGSDSMSVSSRDSIWGSMLTFAYCFFSTWCWKNTGILWVHPNLVGNMAVFVARFGYLITTPNLLHFGLKFLFWRLSEDVRTRCCQRTLHNQKPKYAIGKKKSVTSKTHNGQKKMSIRFSRYIYIYIHVCSIM